MRQTPQFDEVFTGARAKHPITEDALSELGHGTNTHHQVRHFGNCPVDLGEEFVIALARIAMRLIERQE